MRVVARADNHVVLGVQAVGAGVSELSTAFGLALEMQARLAVREGMASVLPALAERLGPDAALMAFGGAGPVHAAHCASELNIPFVVVPRNPGLASAFGQLRG